MCSLYRLENKPPIGPNRSETGAWNQRGRANRTPIKRTLDGYIYYQQQWWWRVDRLLYCASPYRIGSDGWLVWRGAPRVNDFSFSVRSIRSTLSIIIVRNNNHGRRHWLPSTYGYLGPSSVAQDNAAIYCHLIAWRGKGRRVWHAQSGHHDDGEWLMAKHVGKFLSQWRGLWRLKDFSIYMLYFYSCYSC